MEVLPPLEANKVRACPGKRFLILVILPNVAARVIALRGAIGEGLGWDCLYKLDVDLWSKPFKTIQEKIRQKYK